jgi:SAM-dependent methyltransferase
MTLNVRIMGPQEFPELRNPWADRNGFGKAFKTLVMREPGLKGRVLDIGCGNGLTNKVLTDFTSCCGHLDGVDPSPQIMEHPALENRWQGELETAPIPEQTYDAAIAFNVVEHVKDPERFISRLWAVLKPGGVFWALTPHARHPFCWFARGIELIGFKDAAADRYKGMNRYSSYYRLNTIGRVKKLSAQAGFVEADFYRFPAVQWDCYFPPMLRWAPHAYDRLLGLHVPACMQIIVYRLQRA